MAWNWELPNWPRFSFDSKKLEELEKRYLLQGGLLAGVFRHFSDQELPALTADLLTSEALQTSAIEGEVFDRASVQSSIRHQLGLSAEPRRAKPGEQGVAEVTVDLFRNPLEPLTHETLFRWHEMLMRGRNDIADVGHYRTHEDPMQIVSGRLDRPQVHFAAPPSERVSTEMDQFLTWFNSVQMGGIAFAGVAHVYFESIHPFEDGNGRIGRAISEKALSLTLGRPSLALLSTQIQRRRKEYYDQIGAANLTLEITDWLLWFGDVVLAAQQDTEAWINFVLAKVRLFETLGRRLNSRQEKALLRITRDGPAGFLGGLSAGNYQAITGTTTATANRDLRELVEMGALVRTGQLKGTRYWINIDK